MGHSPGIESGGHGPEAARHIDVLQRQSGKGRGLPTKVMKRAAIKANVRPKSTKKSASKGIAWRGNTRWAAASSTASVVEAGGSCTASASAVSGRALQGFAIDLAGNQPRQLLDPFEMAGHHIGRQRRPQDLAQARRIVSGIPFPDQEGDQAVASVVGAQHDGGLCDPAGLYQPAFDLAQLDAKAADLHLVVDPSMEQQAPLAIETDRVADR